ncbi:MAG: GntR family transcriptional regulator [Rhodospirillales bacterium 20-64-7]|nr:MAG: GntR family transcriptional regulator [Rhodospirillales bacterium 20-64-7]
MSTEPAGLVLGRRQLLGDQLYGQIFEQIVSGKLAEGTRLPAEQALCRMFGVSRPVVRQALQRLAADGLVHARQGAGTFVMARPADRLRDYAEPREVAEFLRCVELRLILEGSAARFAAERRSEAELARIRAAQDGFAAEAAAGAATPASDLAFHRAIAEAAGNHFYPDLLRSLHESLSGFMTASLMLTRTSAVERAAQVLREHEAIFAAIALQEPESAEIAMRFHISQARLRMIDRRRG